MLLTYTFVESLVFGNGLFFLFQHSSRHQPDKLVSLFHTLRVC
jgi:hypothetical protein